MDKNKISLFDLPKEQIRVKLKQEFREKVFSEMLKKYSSFSGIAKKTGLKRGETARRYFIERSGMPLSFLVKIPELLKISEKTMQENTIELRTMKSRECIKNPKLPFETTPELALVVGGVLGDGGIEKNRQRVWYFNREKEQIESFVMAVKYSFGEVNFAWHRSISGTPCVIFPKIIGVVLQTIGLDSGNKNYKLEQEIPKVLLKSKNRQVKIALLQRLFDDDGTVYNNHNSRCVSFISPKIYSLENVRKEPTILINIKQILSEFEVHSKICGYRKYQKDNGETTVLWEIRITGKENMQKFYDKIGFGLARKQAKLKQVLERYVKGLEFYPRNTAKRHYLDKLKELTLKNIELNSTNIAKACKRNERHVREVLMKLFEDGFLTRKNIGNKFVYSMGEGDFYGS